MNGYVTLSDFTYNKANQNRRETLRLLCVSLREVYTKKAPRFARFIRALYDTMIKNSSLQNKFYSAVSTILWEKWDPIGVNDGDGEWSDEYDSYVPHIYRLAMNGNDADCIAKSLTLSVTQSMGMGQSPSHDLKVAKLIVKAKAEIIG